MKYQLQLETGHGTDRYIITGDEWLERIPWGGEFSGVAIIYPEHDLLWFGLPVAESERFGSLKNFKKEFNSLPRWEATRYVVVECEWVLNWGTPQCTGKRGIRLVLFDSRTGEMLTDGEGLRLRRIIEQMMRGESFCFM